MQITRLQGTNILKSIQSLQKNENFSITTKYKILKIKSILEQEQQFVEPLMTELGKKYGFISEDGSIIIKRENADKAKAEFDEFNNQLIELPDLTISLDELSSEVKWEQLEAFLPFIKE